MWQRGCRGIPLARNTVGLSASRALTCWRLARPLRRPPRFAAVSHVVGARAADRWFGRRMLPGFEPEEVCRARRGRRRLG